MPFTSVPILLLLALKLSNNKIYCGIKIDTKKDTKKKKKEYKFEAQYNQINFKA